MSKQIKQLLFDQTIAHIRPEPIHAIMIGEIINILASRLKKFYWSNTLNAENMEFYGMFCANAVFCMWLSANDEPTVSI